MKKLLTLILALCLICSAAFAEIDLSSMAEEDLIALQEQITIELDSRKEPPAPTAEPKKTYGRMCTELRELHDAYDFQGMHDYVDSGVGVPESYSVPLFEMLDQEEELLKTQRIDKDIFTGEITIYPTQVDSLSKDFCVVPTLTGLNFNMTVGFVYDDSISYDVILIANKSGEPDEIKRKWEKYEIEFERIDGESWEYSYLSNIELSITEDNPPLGISFRRDSTNQKADHVFSDAEKEVLSNMYALREVRRAIDKLLVDLSWEK